MTKGKLDYDAPEVLSRDRIHISALPDSNTERWAFLLPPYGDHGPLRRIATPRKQARHELEEGSRLCHSGGFIFRVMEFLPI